MEALRLTSYDGGRKRVSRRLYVFRLTSADVRKFPGGLESYVLRRCIFVITVSKDSPAKFVIVPIEMLHAPHPPLADV